MSIYNREITKILKQIDKIAKGGRENYLDYYFLIDEMVKKSKWDMFKQSLYYGYYIDVEKFSINDAKVYSWREILKSTNKSIDEKKFRLFKSKGVWTQALNYYLESNSFKLGEIKETIFYLEGEYQFYSQQIFDKYRVTTQNKFLEQSKIKLDVNVNHVLPFPIPSITNGVWEELDVNWEILNLNWEESSGLTQSYSQIPLYGSVSGFVLLGDARERVESGLKLLGLSPVDVNRILKRPNNSIDYLLVDSKYRSFLDQKIKIIFNLKIVPTGGVGSLNICIYDHIKKSPKIIPFVAESNIGTASNTYQNYEYVDGEEVIISGERTIDVKSGDLFGIGLYNTSDVEIDQIDFIISECSVNFVCQEIKNPPKFFLKSDIDWIRLNNSCRVDLIGEVSTRLPKLSDENVTFSDWDDELSRDKNIINLYTEAIDYLIQNYQNLSI